MMIRGKEIRTVSVVGALVMVAATAGCDTTGSWGSYDKHLFPSTPHQPTTVQLWDSVNQREQWKMDIAVNHSLLVDLDRKGEYETWSVSGYPATVMRWWLLPLGKTSTAGAVRQGTVDLAGTPVYMKIKYRPAPERPGQLPPPAVMQPAAPAPGAEPAPPATKASGDDADSESDVERAESKAKE